MARRCPRCTFALTPTVQGTVELDHCDRCGGNFFDPGESRATFGELAEPSHWVSQNFARTLGESKLRCPAAHGPMERFELAFADQQVEVEVCPSCKGLWLDQREASPLLDLLEHEHAAALSAEISAGGARTYLFQLLTGFPIEVYNPVRRRPWLMIGLLLTMVACFVAEIGLGEALVKPLSLIPSEIAGGRQLWGIFSYALLHGGLIHLLGNLYFFWIFGDNVEDTLGRWGFLAVFAVAAVAGGALHLATNLGSTVPVLGASGGIAGLMAAYLVLFPRTKLWVVFFFIRFRLGVLWYFGIWIGFQFLNASLGVPGIAWYAHIGGFFAGGLVALLLKPRRLTRV